MTSYGLVNSYYYWKSLKKFGALEDYIYALGFSENIYIISLKEEASLSTVVGTHESQINSVKVIKDEKTVFATVGDDKYIKIWDE